jgi:hypothetical protein
MRYKNLLPLLMLASGAALQSQAQLYNNGASIKIQPGAVIFVSGDVQNNSGGTISNDGKLEVQGNFINSATYSSAGAEDSLILSGAGNVLLNGGASTINYLTINKASNANTVTLSGTTLLGKKLDYTSGSLSTDPINNPTYLFSAPVSAVFNYTAGREITGRVRRTSWTNGTTAVFNQTNMLVATNSGTAPTDFTVTMIPNGDPTQAEREVKRKFAFAQTGGTGFNTDVRFAYQDAELNTNLEPTLVPWQLTGGEWNARAVNLRDATANYVATATIAAADLGNEWKLADASYSFNATVYLKGAWNNPTGLMRTLLNSNGLLPLTQPFSAALYPGGSESVASIPNANIVDWVLIELRKPTTGAPQDAVAGTFTGRKAAFLLNNGTIVDLDGVTPVKFNINKQGPGNYIVIRHRNHLGIMSNGVATNAAGTFSNDFSLEANVYAKPSATSAPVSLLSASAPGNTKYGMWPGDINANGSVTASDITPINTAIAGPSSGNTNVYNVRDANMDRNVTSADVSVTNSSISGFASTSASKTGNINQPLPNANKQVTSHIPGEAQ